MNSIFPIIKVDVLWIRQEDMSFSCVGSLFLFNWNIKCVVCMFVRMTVPEMLDFQWNVGVKMPQDSLRSHVSNVPDVSVYCILKSHHILKCTLKCVRTLSSLFVVKVQNIWKHTTKICIRISLYIIILIPHICSILLICRNTIKTNNYNENNLVLLFLLCVCWWLKLLSERIVFSQNIVD